MRDVGITDGARLRVTMHPSDPEDKTRKELYERVKQVVHDGISKPICIKDGSGDEVPDDNTKLCDADYIYDGVTLVSEIRSQWSLIVLHQGGSSTLTISVPANCYVREVFDKVKEKVNVGEELRLTTGTKELNTELDSRLQSVELSHGSSVCIVMRQRGGT